MNEKEKLWGEETKQNEANEIIRDVRTLDGER